LPNGLSAAGQVQPDGSFLADVAVPGHGMVQGYFGQDPTTGSWNFWSADGTIFWPVGGQAQTGVTTPDGHFLQGGATYTTASGQLLYGFWDNGSFWTFDHTTIVVNNIVIAGSTDLATGIFTVADNGGYYFIGQGGIIPVTPNPDGDGSYVEPDGTVIMTPKSWFIDMAQFSAAMQTVSSKMDAIMDSWLAAQALYPVIMAAWSGPAATSFADFTPLVDSVLWKVYTVLMGVRLDAMQQSFDNYVTQEQQAIQTFQQNAAGQ
jgi:hypothetical protein